MQPASESLPEFIGTLVPRIIGRSASVLTAGSDAVITFTGSAFKNTYQGTEMLCKIMLSPDVGSSLELNTVAISENEISVNLPGNLSTGNYTLRAVKEDKVSNPVALSIKPDVVITDVSCSDNTLTVTGSGFGDVTPEGTEGIINVEVDNIPVSINAWADTQIQAVVQSCPGMPEEVTTVNALYGSAGACACLTDLNGDDTVGLEDLVIMRVEYFKTDCDVNPCQADCNGDGEVGLSDLLLMKDEYFRTDCCQ
jgi:hypothetical protein